MYGEINNTTSLTIQTYTFPSQSMLADCLGSVCSSSFCSSEPPALSAYNPQSTNYYFSNDLSLGPCILNPDICRSLFISPGNILETLSSYFAGHTIKRDSLTQNMYTAIETTQLDYSNTDPRLTLATIYSSLSSCAERGEVSYKCKAVAP